MAQKVWVEWIEQGLANGEYNRHDYKDLTDVEQIGSSKVYKALMKKDEEETTVTMKYIGNKLSTREVQSELKLLRYIQSFNNENISKFYGITKSDSNDKNQLKYMVMLEYGDGGTLREYLQNNSENLHWSVLLNFARQLSNAIAFLHLLEKPIAHKNLHSHNIIINQQNLKLRALGITCKMSESSNVSTNLQQYLAYVDPQYFKIPSYKSSHDKQSALTKKSDIYSLGVLLWELSSKKLPFSSEEHSDLQKEIMEGLREKDIGGIDQAYISIYKKCWQDEPDDRPEILDVVSALEELDDGIDPSMVQKNKKAKQTRRFSIKEPPAPVSPVTKPEKSSATKPQVNTTPPPPKPQVNTTPPPSKPQVNTTPPPPKPQVPPSTKPQVNKTTQPQPPKPQVNITLPPPKPQVNITQPPPKPQVNTTTPQPKPQVNPPPKLPINKPPPSPIIIVNRDSPKLRSSPEATIIEEDEEEGESTRINSPIGSESSTLSAITTKSDVVCQSPVFKAKRSSMLIRSESPRSLSPRSLSPRSLSPNKRQSRHKSKSPMGRVVGRSPSRKSLTRGVSPNFTTREPRASKRSASVSLPRNTPKLSRRAQTVVPSQPRSPSPKKFSHKPTNRRYSTGVINSSMQINAQSSLIGLWSNTSDRREDPLKKVIDELLSLFMETYEVDPGHTLLKTIQEFLENQEEETFKIFDWLLTTQLSLQYEILLGYFYLNGIGTPVGNRKAFVLFLSAAKKQYAIAQDLLGYCYLNGKGTVKDEILAFEWYHKAAANGCITAFQSLGQCYHNSIGTVKSKIKALQYFKMASDGGNVCGKNMLAFCYEMGLGVSPDHKKAFNLYKQAADAGYNLAKQNVAKCYQNGIGVTADLEAAAYWLEKSN